MGRFKSWGDAFARWYDGSGQGKRRAFWLGLIVMVVLGSALIGPTHDFLFGSNADKVVVWCDPQGRETIDGKETPKVTISPDDPRFDRNDLDASMDRICNPTM